MTTGILPPPIATVFTEPVLSTFLDPSQNWTSFHGCFTYDPAITTFEPPIVQAAGLTSGWVLSAVIT